MPNYLRQETQNSAPTSRRKIWLATGTAGLTSVVGLFGVPAASAGAAGADRIASPEWSTAEQVVDDDALGRDDGRGEVGADREGRAARHGQDASGGDPRHRTDATNAKDVPCDTGVLIEELNRANRASGGVFKLARNCTYAFAAQSTAKVTGQTGNGGFPVIDKRITILGDGSTFSEGFRIITVNPGGELTLTGVTVTGGRLTGPPDNTGAADGGGILIQPGGQAVIENSMIVGNSATGNGGGIANFGELELRASIVADNRACNGGGIYNAGEMTIDNSRISRNIAAGNCQAGGNGGGIANAEDGTATIAHSMITGNKARNDGGGISNDGNSAMLLEGVIIGGNKATNNGGGVFHDSTAGATIRNALFIKNTAGDNGGGLFNGGTLDLPDSGFKDNHAEQGGAIYNDNDGVLDVDNSTIVGNVASATRGAGGIYNNGAVRIDTTIIKKNEPRNCTNVPHCVN
ncbi:hypothetical protein KBX63_30860 [Micromonospora sp. U21]|nr:hypothetical protein [Micromonospora sp. U21]